MKNYTHFLTHKTEATKHYGNVLNKLDLLCENKEKELEIIELELGQLQYERRLLCNQIEDNIIPLYKNMDEFLDDCKKANIEAIYWNNKISKKQASKELQAVQNSLLYTECKC